MALIPDFYINAVVAIGEKENGITRWFGTGFFVGKESLGGGYYLYLVVMKLLFFLASSYVLIIFS